MICRFVLERSGTLVQYNFVEVAFYNFFFHLVCVSKVSKLPTKKAFLTATKIIIIM